MTGFKAQWVQFIEDLQDAICAALEARDSRAKFREDKWERPGGGGGRTRVISGGDTWEKGGVNISSVHGEVTDTMRRQLQIDGHTWFAAGLSLVIHPLNPFVPTVHCNYRMFELYDASGEMSDRWFGGGTDLTPYYLFEEDVRQFHGVYKKACDEADPGFYPRFKKECDDYFVNTHRNNERRGVGGIFYDHQRADAVRDEGFWLKFAQDCGYGLIDSYLPIADRRRDLPWTDANRFWQEIRRGRYTEFNLVHDRGTIFGLKTNGRTESILMSLPPTVRFEYDYKPEPGSEEDKLWKACLSPVEWL
ncbi:MAG: oxygen-dependent coproporphyrinogen oxidase [Chitinophagaceae bacterium]|nr:MAG: oxygen-dependent coproporphyrinogen oxidase [Chitinophagaceae bacterium]